MKSNAQTYRIPIMVTFLMVIALILWAWQSWQSAEERSQERHRQRAAGAFDTIERALTALAHEGHLGPDAIENVFKTMIHNSPIRFVVVEQGGRRLLQVGNPPQTLILPSETGENLTGGRFLYWRPVNFQSNVLAGAQEHLPTGKQVMAVGFDLPQESRSFSGAQRGIVITFVVALLFVAASMVAWIMAIRSRLLAEQLHVERERRAHLEQLGLAAAGLVHETKNPLGIILGIAQQISSFPGEPEQSRVMLEHIMDEVDKAAARLGNFLTFARQRKVHAAASDVQKICAKVAEILKPDFEAVGVHLDMDCSPIQIMADEELLRQILVNLLLNSLHASSAGSRVEVRIARRGKRAVLTVEDHGTGIPPELLPSIFQPYVAGTAGGHGLGLSIVKRFVEEHGWTVGIDSQPGRGTVVTISGIALAEEGVRP